jgi:hypothetical protein
MKARKERDPQFLVAAGLAAAGGLSCIFASIGFPLWATAHGRPVEPTFVFFGLWGIMALAGAAANIYTYLESGPPPQKPRGGGQRMATIHTLDARRANATKPQNDRRAA